MSLASPNDTNSVGWKNLFASFLFAKEPRPLDEKPEINVRPQYLVDIHTHVSMKMNIWGKKFWKAHTPAHGDGFLSMLGMQVDFHRLRCGHVGVMIVPHDIPVGAMRRQFKFLSNVIRLLNRWFDKMEHEDFSNFTQINKIINLFEEQIYITNRKLGSETFVIARSFEDLMFARKQGKIVFVHAIEGSHALGRNEKPEVIFIPRKPGKHHLPVKGVMGRGYGKGKEYDRYLDNLVALKHRGVCMLTLAYLFPNEISDCVEGIAEFPKMNSFKYERVYDPVNEEMNKGLSPLGREVVKKMLEIGMIIDLMHSTDAARRHVYELHDEWVKDHPIESRPITFSHGGSRALHEKYHEKTGVTKYSHHKYYGASREDILAIERSGGVIGIIIERWWLTGVDTRLPEFEGWELTGIDCVIETIFDINEQTEKKDFSCISIGTDFDGFTDTPPDLFLYEQLGNLLEKMRARLTEEQITKIFSGNALRMLELGWKTM